MIPYSVSIKYLTAGYTTILIVLAAYLVSLFLRWRRLKREMKVLKELDRQKTR